MQPYMVDTSDGPRGIQVGYNLCNSTTEGPNSLCQTATVNNLDGMNICSCPGLTLLIGFKRFLYLGSTEAKLNYCRH